MCIKFCDLSCVYMRLLYYESDCSKKKCDRIAWESKWSDDWTCTNAIGRTALVRSCIPLYYCFFESDRVYIYGPYSTVFIWTLLNAREDAAEENEKKTAAKGNMANRRKKAKEEAQDLPQQPSPKPVDDPQVFCQLVRDKAQTCYPDTDRSFYQPAAVPVFRRFGRRRPCSEWVMDEVPAAAEFQYCL